MAIAITPFGILVLLLAIFVPPLGVLLECGLGKDFLINVLLTLLGYIPGQPRNPAPSHPHTAHLLPPCVTTPTSPR